ncbi:pickpocket protein 19-like, partial [Aphis craccivora]
MTLKSIWVDYCENGSIHGLRHIIQKDEKPWMRFIWVLLLIVASIAIVVLVSASWEKYSYSSMEITVDDPRYPITKIDFPAVTICPISKIMYSKALDLVLNKYSNDSDLRIKWANSLQALSRIQFPHNTNLYFILQNKSTVNIPLNDISDLMLKLAPSIEDIFKKCIWRGAMYKCKDILRFQRTEEGFCYSFNSQTAERNVNDQSQINPPLIGSDGVLIPLRNNAAGKGTGLSLIMSNMSDSFFPNDNRRRGFN